jgi:hypothetical protein
MSAALSDPHGRHRTVTVTCQGRTWTDDGTPGPVCGRTLRAPETTVLARARAAGWRVGTRRDGTPDAMCPRCAAPDPEIARGLGGGTHEHPV